MSYRCLRECPFQRLTLNSSSVLRSLSCQFWLQSLALVVSISSFDTLVSVESLLLNFLLLLSLALSVFLLVTALLLFFSLFLLPILTASTLCSFRRPVRTNFGSITGCIGRQRLGSRKSSDTIVV